MAYISGTVDEELLLRNEHLVAENRILMKQQQGHLRFTDPQRKTLVEIGFQLGRKALADECTTPSWQASFHSDVEVCAQLIMSDRAGSADRDNSSAGRLFSPLVLERDVYAFPNNLEQHAPFRGVHAVHMQFNRLGSVLWPEPQDLSQAVPAEFNRLGSVLWPEPTRIQRHCLGEFNRSGSVLWTELRLAAQTTPHHELSFAKVQSPFCQNPKTHGAVLPLKKSGGFEQNGV